MRIRTYPITRLPSGSLDRGARLRTWDGKRFVVDPAAVTVHRPAFIVLDAPTKPVADALRLALYETSRTTRSTARYSVTRWANGLLVRRVR